MKDEVYDAMINNPHEIGSDVYCCFESEKDEDSHYEHVGFLGEYWEDEGYYNCIIELDKKYIVIPYRKKQEELLIIRPFVKSFDNYDEAKKEFIKDIL